MVNNSTNINKTNNNLSPKKGLNSDGQQFHQYQQNKQATDYHISLVADVIDVWFEVVPVVFMLFVFIYGY